MKYPILIGLVFFSNLLYSQAIGFEARTNDNSYLSFFYRGFESRHLIQRNENRFTYRQNFNKDKKLGISIPFHYKLEKNQMTLEPRLIMNFDEFKLLIQKEFWFNEPQMNTAIAIDYKKKNITYRLGWDTSDTFRFRLKYKFSL